jgi:hypothetical protein
MRSGQKGGKISITPVIYNFLLEKQVLGITIRFFIVLKSEMYDESHGSRAWITEKAKECIIRHRSESDSKCFLRADRFHSREP